MSRNTLAGLTKYEKIFERTYWGSSLSSSLSLSGVLSSLSSINKEVIENRNKFVEEHNIVGKWNAPHSFNEYWNDIQSADSDVDLDHLELYKTDRRSIIIVISPYLPPYEVCCRRRNAINSYGFIETYELYNRSTTSFYKEIEMSEIKKYDGEYKAAKRKESGKEEEMSQSLPREIMRRKRKEREEEENESYSYEKGREDGDVGAVAVEIVRRMEYNGMKYLVSKETNVVYDMEEYVLKRRQKKVGKYNPESKKIEFKPESDSSSEDDNEEYYEE